MTNANGSFHHLSALFDPYLSSRFGRKQVQPCLVKWKTWAGHTSHCPV